MDGGGKRARRFWYGKGMIGSNLGADLREDWNAKLVTSVCDAVVERISTPERQLDFDSGDLAILCRFFDGGSTDLTQRNGHDFALFH